MATTLYFVDAYNLLHKDPELAALLAKDPGAARSLLYRWLRTLRGSLVEDLRVVVDGARLPVEEVPTELSVSWARAPESADQRILKLLLREARRARSHRPLIVVSDDRELREQARFRGAQLMACSTFIRDHLGAIDAPPDPKRPGHDSEEDRLARERGDSLRVRKGGAGLSEAEAEKWLELFGEEEQTPGTPGSFPEVDDPDLQEQGWQGAPPAPEGTESSHAPEAREPDPDPGRAPKKHRRTRPLSAEEAEYARLLGVDPDDPGLYDPDRDEESFEE